MALARGDEAGKRRARLAVNRMTILQHLAVRE